MGFDEPCFRDSDEDICRTALKGVDWGGLKAAGWQRLPVPERFAPFAQGGFPTPSGKCEFYSEWLEKQGLDPLPFYNPPAEVNKPDPDYPLAFLSPPARNFLNSTFVNVESIRQTEREPVLEISAADAASRGIADGAVVRVFNARGEYFCKAVVTPRARSGVVHGLGVWWRKFGLRGTNVNQLTSQQLTDLGRGPVFYDCLVEVQPA